MPGTYRHQGLLAALGVLLSLQAPIAQGQAASATDLLSLSLEELAKLNVSIATGSPRPQLAAPAVTSVITAREIAAMGARHMADVLQTVPGLQVSHGGLLYQARYYFRGIFSNSNPHTLVMVNGTPMSGLSVGDRVAGWPGVPVESIARIEIIRGPGSAVYGADAFAGVINIITKGPEDIEGGQAGTSYGSFDTPRAHLLQGGKLGPVHASVALSYAESDGDDSQVDADWQTQFDQLFGTRASLAPGPLNRSYRHFDSRLTLAWGAYRLHAAWTRLWDVGTGQGLADALDPQGRFEDRFTDVDLTWNDPTLFRSWNLEARLSAAHKVADGDPAAMLLPPGTTILTQGGMPVTFPEGLLNAFYSEEAHARASFTALYTGWSQHRLRLGSGYAWGDMFETRERKNYNPDLSPRAGGLTDVSDTPEVFLPEAQRTNTFVFVQDEWAFVPDWELTTGVRYDHYSDFGDTINPRVALVWLATPALTSKLLYGEAFRAPALSELYGRSALGIGDPDLKPEKLRNLELALGWRPNDAWMANLNLYAFRIDDFIENAIVPGQAAPRQSNVGRYEGRGAEFEVRHQVAALPLQVLANYSLQNMEDRDTGEARGQVPRNKAHLRAIWDFLPNWQLTGQLTRFGRFERQGANARVGTPPDPRADMAGYTTFDLALRKRWQQGVELALIGHNLFDADAREASNGPGPGGLPVARIPDDLPQPGSSLMVELKSRW